MTSSLFTAEEIGGIAGAAALCQAAADAAGLSGAFDVWLSTQGDVATDRFVGSRGWVRPDGKPVFVDLALLPLSTGYALELDENGDRIEGKTVAWTATKDDGTLNTTWGSSPCEGWTANSGNAPAGYVGGGPKAWTLNGYGRPCDGAAHLYCLEKGRDVTLTIEPVAGRRIFVSTGQLASTAGRSAADGLCQQEASNAGLAGTYLALMAEPGEQAADRFDLEGPVWVRYDGLAVFEPDDPMGERLAVPIGYGPSGEVGLLRRTWLGAATPTEVATMDSTCQGWTVETGDTPLAVADHTEWLDWAPYGANEACDVEHSVLCFQE